ncbi:sialate O-acetylesterase [Bacteroides sp. 51]|uniref:sialate O-acetylesterase n=1 Tax=Bacteroides sp. 51 TaxID=2302938 RepID=UPI0013D8BF99|nr:sialate O-acetylesterase [Bacteroides sp. 51]NDV81887.1 sialate O-acetylesterase [Bacteroides sp. 51]
MKNILLYVIAFGVCIGISEKSQAAIKLPSFFCDNMILQQKTETTIWGWSKINATVHIKTSWNNKSYTIRSNSQGKWQTNISTPPAGGPYHIDISDGEKLTLNNVLIGEVWICAGQSNMEMPMYGYGNQPVNHSLDAIVKSQNSHIRLFTVEREYASVPLDDCRGKWLEATPENVSAFSATAYFFGRLVNQVTDIPIGLIVVSWGGSSIKAWVGEENLKPFGDKVIPHKEDMENPKQSPAALYNGMLHPFFCYAIRGAIWYQGESDISRASQYGNYMETMVKDWRTQWKQGDFPFYYAQIAPYNNNSVHNSAYLREAQLDAMKTIPNSGMIVLMDSHSPDCIHPPKKQEAGERFAYWALSETYQIKGIPYKSPAVQNINFENGRAIVTFANARGGLTSYGKEIKSVQLSGDNNRWYPATVVLDENKMYAFSAKVPQPVAIRYAFTDYAESEIFGNQGLPVSSFRSNK